MAAETGFTIKGNIYEVPTIESLDNDERFLLYDYSNVVQEDFLRLPDETDDEYEERSRLAMRHPGFWPALMHIAYRRAHHDMSEKKVRQIIGQTKALEALASLVDEDDVEAVVDPTTASQTPPDEPSSISVPSSSASGGTRSGNVSDGRVVRLATTTTPGSGTSSPRSPDKTSAA